MNDNHIYKSIFPPHQLKRLLVLQNLWSVEEDVGQQRHQYHMQSRSLTLKTEQTNSLQHYVKRPHCLCHYEITDLPLPRTLLPKDTASRQD
jgi:hypothetical protein